MPLPLKGRFAATGGLLSEVCDVAGVKFMTSWPTLEVLSYTIFSIYSPDEAILSLPSTNEKFLASRSGSQASPPKQSG